MTALTNRLVVSIAACSAAWMLFFILLSGRNPGREWYGEMADFLLGDSKGGVPVINLALPVLFAGTVATLYWKLPSTTVGVIQDLNARPSSGLPAIFHRWIHRVYNVDGDWNLDMWARISASVEYH